MVRVIRTARRVNRRQVLAATAASVGLSGIGFPPPAIREDIGQLYAIEISGPSRAHPNGEPEIVDAGLRRHEAEAFCDTFNGCMAPGDCIARMIPINWTLAE